MGKKPKRTIEELQNEPAFREMVDRLEQMDDDKRREILDEISGETEREERNEQQD